MSYQFTSTEPQMLWINKRVPWAVKSERGWSRRHFGRKKGLFPKKKKKQTIYENDWIKIDGG